LYVGVRTQTSSGENWGQRRTGYKRAETDSYEFGNEGVWYKTSGREAVRSNNEKKTTMISGFYR